MAVTPALLPTCGERGRGFGGRVARWRDKRVTEREKVGGKEGGRERKGKGWPGVEWEGGDCEKRRRARLV